VALFDEHRWLHAIVAANPFAILFEAYRSVIYGTIDGPPVAPDWVSLAVLLVISAAFVAGATVLFKRLEPTFAKVL